MFNKISMIKRVLTLVVMVLLQCHCSIVFAQSMSDNQVVQYVVEQQQAGKNQAEIVNNLIKRGVTPDQLQRIRRKITAQKDQLGAVALDGASVKTSPSRLRTDKQLEGESYQMQNNYLVRSQARGYNGNGNYTAEERNLIMNDAISFFDLDSLAYYRNLVIDEDQVFGRNLFNNSQLSFQPNMNIATPAN